MKIALLLSLYLALQVPLAKDSAPCDPKNDPTCGNRSVEEAVRPVPDPISTTGAVGQVAVPCNPKHDPSCENRGVEGSV